MPAHRLLNEQEEAHVAKAYLAGMSATELAESFDVNPDTIRNIVRRRGGELRSRGKQAGVPSAPRVR
jgi:DNA-directed RNA polymerase specialized sigma24 family protein